MLANSRVFHPRKLQTALCKPRENRLCPLRLPNLTISAALITRCVILWRENRHCTHGVLFLAWVEAMTWPWLRPSSHHCALYGIVARPYVESTYGLGSLVLVLYWEIYINYKNVEITSEASSSKAIKRVCFDESRHLLPGFTLINGFLKVLPQRIAV